VVYAADSKKNTRAAASSAPANSRKLPTGAPDKYVQDMSKAGSTKYLRDTKFFIFSRQRGPAAPLTPAWEGTKRGAWLLQIFSFPAWSVVTARKKQGKPIVPARVPGVSTTALSVGFAIFPSQKND